MRADLSTYAAFCQIAIAGLTMQADELEREARQLEPFVRKNSRAPSLAKRQSDEVARLRKRLLSASLLIDECYEAFAEYEDTHDGDEGRPCRRG